MNVSEFERNKPTVTLRKINNLIKLIDNEWDKTQTLYNERTKSLAHIRELLVDMKDSFKKGE